MPKNIKVLILKLRDLTASLLDSMGQSVQYFIGTVRLE